MRSGRVVGYPLEGAGLEAAVEPLSELVHGSVVGLMGDDDLVELSDGVAADGASAADLAVDGVQNRQVVLQDGQ